MSTRGGDMRRMTRTLSLGLLVALFGLLPSIAIAGVTKTPFTATITLTEVGAPDRVWESGPILHVRGEPNEGTVTGDLTGTVSIVNNYNLDPRTISGPGWGTFVIATADITWEGTYRSKLEGGLNMGTFVGHGDDASRIKGSFAQTGEVEFTLEGVIIEPKGS